VYKRQKEDELEEARDEYQRAVRARDDLVNQRDLAEANLDQAQASLDEAQHQLDLVQNGPDQSQVSLLEMRIAAAQAQISAAQAALDSLELTAPFDGVVYDANILLNELVPTGNWAFILVDDSQWYVRTNDLTELEVVQVEVGQAVTLLPDSLPDLELSGEVVDISQTFNVQGGDILYDVLVKLDSLDPRLRWGMTFEVNFME
jgi:multidrug resistance efflux pump